MYILGISAFYHDSASCLIHDGRIIAAAQEERFTRKKHDASFPHNAVQFCLNQAQINPSDIDYCIFYEKPFVKFERLLETYLAFAPKGFLSFASAIPVWIKNKLFQKSLLVKNLSSTLGNQINWKKRLLFSEHHLSHAASAFYPSPFDKAAVLTLDGVGEWTTTSLAIGNGVKLKVIKEIHFPHSLGLLYSAFTFYLGFKVNSGEYKVMGLAPYGKPKYVDLIKKNLIRVAADGSYQIDMSYFSYATGLTMINKKFCNLFGGLPRKPDSKLRQRDMNLAASIQKVTEEILVKLASSIARETGEKNLCLAGGVALNCVANGILYRKKIFKNIWIQPASGDAGGAIGAALSFWYANHAQERNLSYDYDQMNGSYLGPEFSDNEINKSLIDCGANFHKVNEGELIDRVSTYIKEGKAIGWMQGRMEFGPRALGGRSIIASPLLPDMQKRLNHKIKFRESFRPFAPSVLFEHVGDWFEHESESRYMLLVADVKKDKRLPVLDESRLGFEKLDQLRSIVPAITHVDYSSRIQTVHKDTNSKFYALIEKFYEKTGCPLVVNTSFNVRGEPIVCSPEDAFKCFMGTDLDILAVGNFLLIKEEQNKTLIKNYKDLY